MCDHRQQERFPGRLDLRQLVVKHQARLPGITRRVEAAGLVAPIPQGYLLSAKRGIRAQLVEGREQGPADQPCCRQTSSVDMG